MPLLALLALGLSPKEEAIANLRRGESLLAAAPSIRATFVREDLGGGDYTDLRQTGRVEATREGGVYVHIDRSRRVRDGESWRDTGNSTLAVTDGKTGYDVFFHAHSIQARPQATTPGLASVPPLSAFLGGKVLSELVAKADDVRVGTGSVDFSAPAGRIHAEFDGQGLIRRYTVVSVKGKTQDWRIENLVLGEKPTKGIFAYVPPQDALPYENRAGADAPEVGELAPDFQLEDLKGKPVKLSSLRGKVVVLEFFATWCWSCNQALPFINETLRGFDSRDVARVAVAIRAGRKDIVVWVKEHPALSGFQFLFEDTRTPTASSVFGVSSTPTTFVIGRDGRIAFTSSGYRGPSDELKTAVEAAIRS
jgi:peroxiredoxin